MSLESEDAAFAGVVVCGEGVVLVHRYNTIWDLEQQQTVIKCTCGKVLCLYMLQFRSSTGVKKWKGVVAQIYWNWLAELCVFLQYINFGLYHKLVYLVSAGLYILKIQCEQ